MSRRRQELIARQEPLKNQIQELANLLCDEEIVSEIRKVADYIRALEVKEGEVGSALQVAERFRGAGEEHS
ncbi:MAG: hypothetical protein QXM16_01590 [Nitrososphaerota archaeon]